MKMKHRKLKIFLALSTISLFTCSVNSHGQTQNFIWAKGISGTSNVTGYDIATDGQGNTITVGGFAGTATFGSTQINCPGIRGIFIAKYDMNGNLLWVKRVDNTLFGEGRGVATDSADNILVTGYFEGNATFGSTTLTAVGAEDIFIVKYDSAGNVLWADQAGGSGSDRGQSIATDAWGNSYLTGYFSGLTAFGTTILTSSGGADIFTAKYDQSGNVLWAKQAGGFGNTDEGWAIAVDVDGNCSVTGRFEGKSYFETDSLTSSGGADVFIARYDDSGFFQWVRQAGGTGEDWGLGIAVNGSGHTWVTGQYEGFINFGQYYFDAIGLEDAFIVKYDETGDVLWAESLGDTGHDAGLHVLIDDANYCTVAGNFEGSMFLEDTTLTSHGVRDVFVVQYDKDGDIQWTKQAGGTASDIGYGVALYAPCNYFITGFFNDDAAFGTTTLNVLDNQYEGLFISRLDVFDQHTDSLTLVALYNRTGGSDWTTKTNWLAGSIAGWHGVTTFNNRVTRLDLYLNNVSGSIPWELINLSELNYLMLGHNQLSGTIIPAMGDLTKLTDLYLSYNQLTGTIPTTLANLTDLSRLDLAGNQLSGALPTELGDLTNLTELYLTDNLLNGAIPGELGNLTNLSRLDLTGNQLNGSIPVELGNLTNLSDLYLPDNQLSGSIPSALGNLPRLQALYLNNNQLSGTIPTALGNLTNLVYLILSHNDLSGTVPPELLNIFNLGHLYVSSNRLTDLPDLSSLTYLVNLYIQNNRFTFEDIEPNVGITNFTYSPQDSVGMDQDTTIALGEAITLTVSVGGTANQYQWFKDIDAIPGATNSDYIITSATEAESGDYKCRITNTIAPNLVLYNRPTRLRVRGIGTISFSSTSISFGRVLAGSNVSRSIWIKNAGDNNLYIEQTQMTGPDAESFTMTAGSGTRVVAISDSFRISFQFTPGSTGTKTASLILETNAQSSPHSITLSGMGSLFDVTQDQDLATVGSSFTVTVSFPQTFIPDRFALLYRMAGQTDYQETSLTTTASDTVYLGTIPQDFVTIRGVEYYLELGDGQITATSPPEDAVLNPFRLVVEISQYTPPMTLNKNSYRMVSVPALLDDPSIESVFFDDYGEYDKMKWRLCRYDERDTTFFSEYPNMDEAVIPGRAFWLITRTDLPFDIDNGSSMSSIMQDTLFLDPGWNQIANPFPYPVAWDHIAVTGDVEAPAYYNGEEYEYDMSILNPWEGYFVYNRDNTRSILSIPPVEAENNLSRSVSFMPKATEDDYFIRLAARIPGFQLRDTNNFLGMVRGASVGFDSLDISEAPPIGDYLQISIIEGQDRLAGSFKPLDSQGQIWFIEVLTTLPAEREVEFQLVESGCRPEGMNLHILDLDEECPLPIVTNRLSIRLRKEFPIRRLKVILGPAEFAEAHRETIALKPLDFKLNQNYPNPFNPVTEISYQLGKRTRVILEIFNIQGRKIRTLVEERQSPGFHTVTWEGRDAAGQMVAGGVYFCQMRTESFAYVRKMIFLR